MPTPVIDYLRWGQQKRHSRLTMHDHTEADLGAILDSRYLNTTSNLSDLENAVTARTNLGLVAGGTGDIWVEKAGDTMTGALVITPSANSTSILNVTNQAGTSVLNVDTINRWVGVGTATPTAKLTVRGDSSITAVGAELVTNGAFADASAWTFGANWAHDGTALTGKHTAGSTATLSQAITVTNGAVYYVAFQIKTRTVGSVTVTLNGTAAGVTYASTDTFAPVITAGASGGLVFTPSSDFDGSIDNVSVKLVTPVLSSIDLTDGGGTKTFEWRTVDDVAAIGLNSLRYLSIANSGNVAIGKNSLPNNVTSFRNVAIGSNALGRLSVSNTGYNIAIGTNTLAVNETGIQNIAIGYDALKLAKYSINNVAIGSSALSSLDGRNPDGNSGGNTAIGASALAKVTIGYNNTGIGYSAMSNLTTGASNLSIGGGLAAATTGTSNVGLGNLALYNLTTGSTNVGIGAYTMTGTTTESNNTVIGSFAGAGIGGVGNTFIGASVGYLNLTVKAGRDYNTILGFQAGRDLAGSRNVFIGYRAGYSETGSDRLYIANSDTATPLIYGLFTGAGAGLKIHSQNTAGIPLTVKGITAQSSNLQDWVNSSGTVLASVTAVGGAVFNENGDASGDFRVESDTEANMIFLDANADTDGALYLGGSTNGVKISKGGDVTLLGTAKYERHVQIPAMADGKVANQPTNEDFFTAGGLQYASAGAQYAYCQWEIPDDWDGTDIVFEVDWFPDSGAISGTDAIRWTVEYRAIAEGELINAGTSVTLDNGAGGDTTDYAQYETKHSRFTLTYNNANQPLTAQDHVYFKVSRDTSVANDFGGTVTVTAYEIIYQSKGFPTSN